MSNPHPHDECECGDYRKDHADGAGRCCMPNDLTHGFQTCSRFRLAFTAEGPGSREAVRAATIARLAKGAIP